ncbi:MAG: hypothetical protein V2A73_21310 [Pseudomonadota bacterium]
MAGNVFCIGFTDVVTVVNTWKTMASIRAPTNQMVHVKRVKVVGAGIAGDAEPLGVRLARVTAGTGTRTVAVAQKLNNALPCAVQSTVCVNFTAAPTDSGTDPWLYPSRFHAQGGQADDVTFDDLWIAENTELALQVRVPSGGTAITATGHIVAEE